MNRLLIFGCKAMMAVPGSGTRCGYDDFGVYIHHNHLKRYFGLVREYASVALKKAVGEAVPKTKFSAASGGSLPSSDRLLGNLFNNLESVSSQAREEVLRAAFKACDTDGNGTLCKDEMVALLRRIMPTMSGRQVVDMMTQADKNKNNKVDYREFVEWITKSAPKQVKETMEKQMGTEFDCVRAVFRLWDRNGDGLISRKELNHIMKQTCPDMSSSQVDTLCLHLDKNRDGQIDYDEFLEFLFG